MMRKVVFWLPMVAVVVLVAGFALVLRYQGQKIAIGTPAPPLETVRLNASGVKLVNFWASWCAPCRDEHPNLSALQAQGIPIYGVSFEDTPAEATRFFHAFPSPYVVNFEDPEGQIAAAWGVRAIPETFVIDGQGRIAGRIAGPLSGSLQATRLQEALDLAASGD